MKGHNTMRRSKFSPYEIRTREGRGRDPSATKKTESKEFDEHKFSQDFLFQVIKVKSILKSYVSMTFSFIRINLPRLLDLCQLFKVF